MSATWPMARLGDVLAIRHGHAFKGEYFQPKGDQLVLTPGNFRIGGGLQIRDGRERFYEGPYPDEFVLAPGDLLIAMTDLTQPSPILGSPLVVPAGGTYLHNQRLGKVEVIDPSRLDAGYAYYLFASDIVRSQLRGSATGSTVRHTSPGRVEAAKAPLPPVATQRKVAAILSACDDLIENNHRRIEVLEQMALRIYHEWFVEFRYPGHEGVTMASSGLGPLPQSWHVIPFTDMADVLSGGTPRTSDSENWDGSIPFFTPRDASDRLLVATTEKHITEIGLARCNSRLYPEWTIFITARGTVGKVVMAAVPMAMNQSCYAIRGNGIRQEFVLFALKGQVDYLRTNTGGATFDTIIVDTFRRMRCILPATPIAEAFADTVAPLIRAMAVHQAESAAARAARDLLLPRLVSGEVDVSALDIAMPPTAA